MASDVRVLLTGTYNHLNKGDAAMQLVMSGLLREALGDAADIRIYSPFPHLDEPFYAPVPVAFDDRRRLIRGSVGVIAGELHRAFADADLVIDLSGDMLTEDYGAHVAWSHFLPLLRAYRAKTPYFVCAQSIGPFRYTMPLARRLLKAAAAVTVRDTISLDYLHETKIDCRSLRQTADMAFLLPPASREDSLSLIRKAGLDPARPIVAVSLSRLVADRYDRNQGKGAFVDLVARELDNLAPSHAVQFLFVAHVTGPGEHKDDRIIAREVLMRMSEPEAVLLDADSSPQVLKGVIACCFATIGCRMHAGIASLSSNVPVLAIAYSHKTPGIMRACGLEEMVLDVDSFTPTDFRHAAVRLLESREGLFHRMQAPIESQKRAAKENLDIAIELIRRVRRSTSHRA